MPGQTSALDHAEIARGRDVGNVTVRQTDSSGTRDIPYFIDFAFAFNAFHPGIPMTQR